jgi:hypothetical protein
MRQGGGVGERKEEDRGWGGRRIIESTRKSIDVIVE